MPEVAVETFYRGTEIIEKHGFINRILQCVQAATSGIQVPAHVGAHMNWRLQGPVLSAFEGTVQSSAMGSLQNEEITMLSSKVAIKPSYPFKEIHGKPYLVNRIIPDFKGANLSMPECLYLGAFTKFPGHVLSVFESSNRSFASKSSSRGPETPKDSRGWIPLVIYKLWRTTMTAPLTRVQLLLQSQREMIKSGQLSKPYKGIMDCCSRTVKTEGFFSLWRGNAVSLLTWLSYRVVGDPVVNQIRKAFHYEPSKYSYLKWFAGFLAGGAVASVVSVSLIHPLIYAHTRWANDVKNNINKRQFNSLRDVFMKTIRSEGVAGLYRGLSVSIAYFSLAAMIYSARAFLVLKLEGFEISNSVYATVALLKALELWSILATYPLDTVRRRMMMTCGQSTKYESAGDAFSKIVKKEGFRSFYKGAGVESLKIVIECALYIAIAHVYLKHVHPKVEQKLNTDGWKTALPKKTSSGDENALQKNTTVSGKTIGGDAAELQNKTDDGDKTWMRIRFIRKPDRS